jgi:hypothetical protein
MGLVYDLMELPEVTTARARVTGVLHRSLVIGLAILEKFGMNR